MDVLFSIEINEGCRSPIFKSRVVQITMYTTGNMDFSLRIYYGSMQCLRFKIYPGSIISLFKQEMADFLMRVPGFIEFLDPRVLTYYNSIEVFQQQVTKNTGITIFEGFMNGCI